MPSVQTSIVQAHLTSAGLHQHPTAHVTDSLAKTHMQNSKHGPIPKMRTPVGRLTRVNNILWVPCCEPKTCKELVDNMSAPRPNSSWHFLVIEPFDTGGVTVCDGYLLQRPLDQQADSPQPLSFGPLIRPWPAQHLDSIRARPQLELALQSQNVDLLFQCYKILCTPAPNTTLNVLKPPEAESAELLATEAPRTEQHLQETCKAGKLQTPIEGAIWNKQAIWACPIGRYVDPCRL